MICRHKLYHFMVPNLVLTGICDRKMIQFMPANHSNTNPVITILIHSDKTLFQNVFVTLLRRVAKDRCRRCFHGISAMILMPQIFDVTANENARYKHNELEIWPLYKVMDSRNQRLDQVPWRSQRLLLGQPLQQQTHRLVINNNCTFGKATYHYDLVSIHRDIWPPTMERDSCKSLK